MTLSKLVLISNSPEARAVEQSDASVLRLDQSGKSLVTSNGDTIELPARNFLLRQNTRTNLTPWLKVLEELEKLSGPNACLAVDFDHPLRELMLVARATGKFRYSLFLSGLVERISVPEYALLGNADTVLWYKSSHAASLRKAYVGHYVDISVQDWQAKIPVAAARESSDGSPKVAKKTSAQPPKRVLLVSYFSGPCRTVAVQRINYWTEQLGKLSKSEIEVHLATAIDWGAQEENIHFVPDLHIASLLTAAGVFPEWSVSFFENEIFDAKHFNTLSYYWRYALEAYFEKLDIDFDAVIISGNPFAVFDFAAFAKRQWYAKVLLDYRDPFANNPRMKYSDSARAHAKFVERGYNFQADFCVAVNEMCLDYLEGGEESGKLVIPNGYDERIFEGIDPSELTTDTINFVHAGSFYHDRSPRALITQLDPGKHSFHHVGNTAGIEEDLLASDGLVCHGRKPYDETLALLGAGDCGIVYVSETGFETPTKLYEYLAFGLDVLICTHGPIKGGALQDVLKDHPGVFWCKNTDEGIREFLADYTPTKSGGKNNERFSRRHAAENLIHVIKGL